MGITAEQIRNAKTTQDAAAHDVAQTVRVVAGPGTGKSFAIEERVNWLLGEQGVETSKVIAVSFTRAASKDLKDRIHRRCTENGHGPVDDLRVSTLHSLALWILRRTGNLEQYPAAPVILDEWESKNIFDAEYGNLCGLTPTRCEEIRLDHEAFWNTGIWNPPNLPVPDEEVTEDERHRFNAFYTARTQTYSCVLPGEVVRRCVELIQQGLIEVVDVLRVEHVIVDEVQDLNPCDFEFIDALIEQGVTIFIAGDDDQSVYSFRHAFPQGIQNFVARYPATGDHVLNDCFRCTPAILQSATSLINTFAAPGRIPKNLASLYSDAEPPNPGYIVTKNLNTAKKEAEYVAKTCSTLIARGIPASEIMILLGNKRATLKTITDAFDNLEDGAVPYDVDQKDDFIESDSGKFVLACLRIVTNAEDYVAHRVILGTRKRVGIRTCTRIADSVLLNNLNFRRLFYDRIPENIFEGRETNALNYARQTIDALQDWELDNTLEARNQDIEGLLTENFGPEAVAAWREFIEDLPRGMNLEELRDYFYGSSVDYRGSLLLRVKQRLGLAIDDEAEVIQRIRILTFHSSKGLSAKVVFIPALEELVFPTQAMGQTAGRVFEGARLLYVAITRAKATCVLTRSFRRIINGQSTAMRPSRYCASLGSPFARELESVMSEAEIERIMDVVELLD